MENIKNINLNSLLIINNQEYWNYLKDSHGDELYEHGQDIIKNIGYYSEYLFKKSNKNFDKNEFIITSIKNLNNYNESLFWLDEPKKSFEFLLSKIKDDIISLEDIYYYLDEDKIINGFTEYINEYISTRKLPVGFKKRKLENLRKQRKLDELLSVLISEMLIEESKETNQK